MDALRVESENLAMVVMCFKVDDQKKTDGIHFGTKNFETLCGHQLPMFRFGEIYLGREF